MTHGFDLLREDTVTELNARAYLYRHRKSGAELLSIANDDENKSFSIAFATPPEDSTGLPHIMEHSVLCGSRKYPVKEPFVELLKSSLASFVNASTYPDKTIYPLASANLQDYYNLLDVYLDAVFYPRLTPSTLQQEGWHYELDDASGEMIYKGVVFNEMKGNYSSGESMASSRSMETLLPDTVYAVDSGGDPKVIPNLTWEQFSAFHKRFYHPSNARIWMSGDDDPQRRLEILDGWLSAFERADAHADIPLQPRFDAPRRVAMGYDAGEEAEDSPRAFVVVNWLTDETLNPEAMMALTMLEYILVSTPASPLRQALMASGLGEDLAGDGFVDAIRQSTFGVGLKNIKAEDAGAIEALVLATLRRLADDGIDQDMVDAALNTIEFRLREMNTGRYPRGLAMSVAALSTWLYGGNPLASLRYEAPIAAVRAALARGERYFETLIRTRLLDNPHRVTLLLRPDPTLRAREDAAETDRLAKARAAMAPDEVDAVIANTHDLRARQAAPDSPEALATIPALKPEDLERAIRQVPGALRDLEGTTLFHHDLNTNGIAYVDLAFDAAALAPEDVPFLGFLGRILLEMGTATEDYTTLARRIRRLTGGISSTGFHGVPRGAQRAQSRSILRAKSTTERAGALFEILRDILHSSTTDNRERLRQIVIEEKSRLEGNLLPSGHGYVLSRLGAQYSPADWVAEQASGFAGLTFLRELAAQIDADWPRAQTRIDAVKAALINRSGLIMNVTLDAQRWTSIQLLAEAFLASLPAQTGVRPRPRYTLPRVNEAFSLPSQVNFVGKAARLYEHGYALHGSVMVASKYLRTTHLWERVRVMGGAYGGFCRFDPLSGVFTYVSYRDPNLLGTLANYDASGAFLREHEVSASEVGRTIVGVIGELDAYLLPDAKGFTALQRHMLNQTPEYRQKLRDEVLSTTARDLIQFADALDAVRVHGTVVVLGGPGAIDAANEVRPGFLDVDRLL
ncbi:MAG: insulinase family protein [Thermoflexales bacterium]